METLFSQQPFRPRKLDRTLAPEIRRHSGIPGIEILPSGRLFAVWYSGPEPREGAGNYVILSTSTDGGIHWREIQAVVPEPGMRAFDSVLWLAPDGRLHWFWTQSLSSETLGIYDGRCGVWCAECDAPDTDTPEWSEPHRLADGVMMNKPYLLRDGVRLLPVALWGFQPEKVPPELRSIARPNLLLSRDNGKNFRLLPGPESDPNGRTYDEHCIVERSDGSWWMLIRTRFGIGESVSRDGGMHWSRVKESGLGGADSRFTIRRLQSGRLLLIHHRTFHRLPGEPGNPARRERLTAHLSDDDGRSWYGGLMLDERGGVSYPDFTQASDGTIFAVYDRERTTAGEILMARFTEADVAAGRSITPGNAFRMTISAFPERS